MISYRAEVVTDGSEGKWISTGFTFATIEEADAYLTSLRTVRTQVRQVRITAATELASHRWDAGKIIEVERTRNEQL